MNCLIHRCVSYELYRIGKSYVSYVHRHVGLKWVFLLKFMILFDLNELLDFVNTKLLRNLIKSNEIANP